MRRGTMKLRAIAVAAVVAALSVAAGCGEKSEDPTEPAEERFDLALDFFVNPDHVGIYETLERGYFADAGLEVEPRVPSDPSAPIKQVAQGDADLAISYEPEVLTAIDQGLPVRAVAALAPEPLDSLISLPEGRIRDVEDLKGKKVATAGIDYQRVFLDAILTEAGLRTDAVERIDVGLNLLPALLGGRVDALFGAFFNIEGVDLKLRGKDPRIVKVTELGIPTYNGLVLVANADRVEDDPEPIRLFLAALERGTRAAERDPKGAAETLLKAEKDLDRRITEAEVEATVPLLLPRRGDRFGFMDPEEWQKFAGFMADQGAIEALPAIDDVLTNELLPGRALEDE